MEDRNNVNKKIGMLVVGIAVLLVSVTSATFAYFALSVNNATAVTGTTATASLSLSVEEQDLKTPNTGKMVPQLGAAIGTAINNTNKCVDANGNIVCKVYKITVTNTSSAGALVNGTITFTNYSGTTNLRWRRIDSATTATTSTASTSYAPAGVTVVMNEEDDLTTGSECVPSNSAKRTGCTDVSLAATSGSADYYIVVWVQETNSDQTTADAGKTFNATVKFEGANGQGITSTITS